MASLHPASPNPAWKTGQKIPSPVEKMVTLDTGLITQQDCYKLLIGAVVPRPIALVSTVDAEGKGNLAPFSFFNAVSSKPMCLSVSIARKPDGSKKDTLRNLEITRELVICSVAEWMVEPVNQTSAEYPHGVDELSKVGLTALPSEKVRPPRVKESPVHFECKVHSLVEVGDGTQGSVTLVIAQVLRTHVMAEAIDQGRVDLEKILPVSRLGGEFYGLAPDYFRMPRPKVDG